MGKALKQGSLIDTIGDFFKWAKLSTDENYSRQLELLSKIKTRIEELILVLKKLDTYRFHTASLLLVYDAYEVPNIKMGRFSVKDNQKPVQFDVRLIDFAHSTHKGFNNKILNEGPDMGFIQGLKTLVQIFDELKRQQIILGQRTRLRTHSLPSIKITQHCHPDEKASPESIIITRN